MAAIIITCPVTSQVVATGQHATVAAFEETPEMGGRFRCSACNQIHSWSKPDASLVATKAHLRRDGAVSFFDS